MSTREVTITKKLVLKALAKEPLTAGQWVEAGKYGRAGCRVCAVGAVLRGAGLKDHAIERVACDVTSMYSSGIGNDLEVALKEKDYLSALSARFEGLARGFRWFVDKQEGRRSSMPYSGYSYDGLRPMLIKFAQETIPDTWKTTIQVRSEGLKRKRK